MAMRFGIRSLLLGVAILALLLSTASGYLGSQGVFSLLGTVFLVCSGFAAAYFQGKRRAFWTSFFATFLLLAFDRSTRYLAVLAPGPRELANELAELLTNSTVYFMFVYRTVWLGWILICATIVGVIVSSFYKQPAN